MIYGMYLSASGVMASSQRQDVIANNLANTETVGFKRCMAEFQQRRTSAQENGLYDSTDPMLEAIGGGLLIRPTSVDHSEGILQETHENLDVAVHGKGYLAVQDGDQIRLTRNGKMMLDKDGNLLLADGSNRKVLDVDKKPISITGVSSNQLTIGRDGTVAAAGEKLSQLGLFNVADESKLALHGDTLMGIKQAGDLQPADGEVQAGFLEGSNVDPMTEMTQLIDAQRQLEANANMIRMQDSTLGRLVNDVAKVS